MIEYVSQLSMTLIDVSFEKVQNKGSLVFSTTIDWVNLRMNLWLFEGGLETFVSYIFNGYKEISLR